MTTSYLLLNRFYNPQQKISFFYMIHLETNIKSKNIKKNIQFKMIN